jgi:hypothetical protein
MEEGTPPPSAELRAELAALKPRALQKRAEAIGVDEDALDEAEDVATNDDPEAGDATRLPGFLKMRDVITDGAPTYFDDPHGDYDYGMPAFAAVVMALMRLLRHLGYPAAIWFVLVANRDVVPVLVFALLSVRQGLHILVVLLCACVNPAFLLVDVGASMRDRGDSLGGYSFLAMYVVAPEKFVALALLGEKGGLNISDGQALLCCALLDLCWVAALGAGLSAGNLRVDGRGSGSCPVLHGVCSRMPRR